MHVCVCVCGRARVRSNCVCVHVCKWLGAPASGAFGNLKVGAARLIGSAWRWWIHWLAHVKTCLMVTSWSAAIVFFDWMRGYDDGSLPLWRGPPRIQWNVLFNQTFHHVPPIEISWIAPKWCLKPSIMVRHVYSDKYISIWAFHYVLIAK